MRILASTAIALALSSQPVLCAEMDGIWRGTGRDGLASSQADLIVAEGLYRLTFSGGSSEHLEHCIFIGQLAGQDVKLLFNNLRQACEASLTIALKRQGPNTLRLALGGGAVKPFEIDLYGIRRATEPSERPHLPESFDTLGARPGMNPAELREALKAHDAKEEAGIDTLVYGMQGGGDILVGIFEGAVTPTSRAIGIRRQYEIAEDRRLTVGDMDQAMIGKYGPPSHSGGTIRQWYVDQDGKIVSPERLKAKDFGCAGHSAEHAKTIAIGRSRVQLAFVSGCGPRLTVAYDTDQNQRVERVRIELLDNALAVHEAWLRQKDGTARMLKEEFASISAPRETPKR